MSFPSLQFIRLAPVIRGVLALLLFNSTSLRASEDAINPQSLSGGDNTVFDVSRNAFTFSARNLHPDRKAHFFTGNSFFNENWVAAPASTSARDGLGPLFIARSCSACHFKDGRDKAPANGELSRTLVVRLSLPGKDPKTGAPKPEPTYGGQLQTRALPGVRGEADLRVQWVERVGAYADGEPYTLRRPRYAFTNEAYGALHPYAHISVRVAPAVIGLGLLEAIPAATLEKLADPDDKDADGISGRVNEVWDAAAGKTMPGRFGWKAEQPSVRQQVAGAFNEDMGLTSSLFTLENHTVGQSNLVALANGGTPEVSDEILDAVVLYAQTLAVPARREMDHPLVQSGEKLFRETGCTACHVPELRTGSEHSLAELNGQSIHPFTDLLLHDLGPGLADGREVFDASGSEWRTPPLWGIGLIKTVNGHTEFLHDGRARNLAEAILWHGGEAERAKEQFRNLSKMEREALLHFLESL